MCISRDDEAGCIFYGFSDPLFSLAGLVAFKQV